MLYKTIVLEILQQQPLLYDQLRSTKTLLPLMERSAAALKVCHIHWMEQLSQTRPHDTPSQLASAALELAIEEFQDSLPQPMSSTGPVMEPLSLDAAMAFLHRHTLPG